MFSIPNHNLINSITTGNNNNVRREGSEEPAIGFISDKRRKRRRDMVERVERLRDDTRDRKDRIFRELSQVHARIADELLPPPVFPSTPFVESLASLPSSIPFSNPIIPGEIFPRPYLFGLHELSFKRSKELLSNRMFHDHQQLIAKTLYEGEVKKVEEEYEMATKGVQLKLMEAILEKKKRLMEEKSSEVALVPLVLSAEFDGLRTHGTRKLRQATKKETPPPPPAAQSFNNFNTPSVPGSLATSTHSSNERDSSPESDSNLTIYGLVPPRKSSLALQGKLLNVFDNNKGPGGGGAGGKNYDPFDLALSLLPTSTSTSSSSGFLSSITGVGPSTVHLSSSVGYGKKKVPKVPGGMKEQRGLPPAHFVVTSGSYNHLVGKSLNGLVGLRGEEIEGDMNSLKRKRGLGRNF